MAVEKTANDSDLRIVYQDGMKADNTPILRTKSYGRVRATATDQEVYDAGMALAGLQSKTLSAIERGDNAVLSEGV